MFWKKKKLLIVISTGKSDGGIKAALGYAFALNALAFKCDVAIFFVGEGAIWGTENRETAESWGFPPIYEMSQEFLSHGGQEYLCIVCQKSIISQFTPRKDVHVAGMISMLPFAVNGKVLVF